MNRTAFYVDNATGNDLYGGSGGTVKGGAEGSAYSGTVEAGTPNVIKIIISWCDESDVGHWLNWQAGGANERRRIVSVDTGASTITVAGAALTPGVDQAMYVGGAFATIEAARAFVTATTANAAGDEPIVWIKSGTTYADALGSFTTSGTAAKRITFAGYTTTPGDGGRCVVRPASIGGAAAVIMSASYLWLENWEIDATGTANKTGLSAPYYGAAPGGSGVRNLKISGADGPALSLVQSDFHVDGAWITDGGSAGSDIIAVSGNGVRLNGLVVNVTSGSPRAVIGSSGVYIQINDSRFFGMACDLFRANGTPASGHFRNCLIADLTGNVLDAKAQAYTGFVTMENCIVAHIAGYLLAGSTAAWMPLAVKNCLFYAYTGAATGNAIDTITGENGNTTDAAPFTGADAAARIANNYQLSAAACRFAGLLRSDGLYEYRAAGDRQPHLLAVRGRGHGVMTGAGV